MSQNSPAARPEDLSNRPPKSLAEQFALSAPQSDPSSAKYVTELVASLLQAAGRARASDIHFSIGESELQILWRIDGVLQPIVIYPRSLTPNIVARLKVMAELLTYRTDVPQEGRLRESTSNIEMRLSTFPTLYGEKAVVRLFASSGRFQLPQELGLPEKLLEELLGLLHETSGAILITGPAGSGKTTTAYACLRELQREFGMGKSLVTLEDPIETVLAGVSQSPVNRTAGFDYSTGLRSLMRQDPDVILVGEIRDRETAETVFQACLTGHLVISTYHAGNAVEAVSRLGDMGIEPYLLRTGLRAILSQRLLRRLCDCAVWTTEETAKLGFNISRVRVPQGCEKCAGTGYQGRFVIAELLRPDSPVVGRAILEHRQADEIQQLAIQQGYQTIGQRAADAIAAGVTSPVEVRRVLGLRRDPETTKTHRNDQ